jgi:hypothetical protein
MHSAVWTGTEMMVMGGHTPSWVRTAGYNPAKDTWLALSTLEIPESVPHPALFFVPDADPAGAGRMLVWGGTNPSASGVYHVSTDTWFPLAQISLPLDTDWSRKGNAVWTGKELIVWDVAEGKGARYTP